MPFGLLVVGLALNWVAVRDQGSGSRDQGPEGGTSRAGSQPQAPCLLVYLSTHRPGPRRAGRDQHVGFADLRAACRRRMRRRGLAGAALAGRGRWRAAGGRSDLRLAVAAYWPFYAHYEAQVGQGAGSLVAASSAGCAPASPLDDWLVIWGFFLLLAVCYVVVVWRRGSAGTEERRSEGAEEQRSEVVITEGRIRMERSRQKILVMRVPARGGKKPRRREQRSQRSSSFAALCKLHGESQRGCGGGARTRRAVDPRP